MGLRCFKTNRMNRWHTLLVGLCLVLVVACGRGSAKRVYLVDESRAVTGSLVSKNGFDPKNAQFSIISREGYRQSPEGLSFDPATNRFSLNLADDKFYGVQSATVIDQILSMGNALPMIGFATESVVSKVERYVRFEVRPARLQESNYQVVPYLQVAIPLTKRNLYSGNDILALGGALELNKAGFIRVTVTNESGAPIVGADVAAVMDGKISADGGTPVPVWHDPMWRPVFSKTDAAGVAYIGPVEVTEATRYQILARATGYCNFLSGAGNIFSISETKLVTVKLRACGADTAAVSSLLPSFPTGLKYFKPTDDDTGQVIVHTNDTKVFLRLDSTSDKFRGAKVVIYETNSKFEPRPDPEPESKEVTQFQGEFDLTIPKIFKTSDSESGRFIIKVTRLPGKSDGAAVNGDQFPDLIIYGRKSTSKPLRDLLMSTEVLADGEYSWFGDNDPSADSNPNNDGIDYWNTVSIQNRSGFENIVPGTAGQTFTISSSRCGAGDELGIQIDSLSISRRYRPCVVGANGVGVATFTAEEAGFVAKAAMILQLGGRQPWRIFIKDKYGNESEELTSTTDPNKRLNVLTVVIDSAKPRIGSDAHPLQNLQFKRTDLPATPTPSPADRFEISKAKVQEGKVTFHFPKSDDARNGSGNGNKTCLQQSTTSDEDDQNGKKGALATLQGGLEAFLYRDDLARVWGRTQLFEEPGQLFVKFALAATEAALVAKPLSEYSQCRSLDDVGEVEPVAVPFTFDQVSFPSDNIGSAEFFLRVMDGSGQLSDVAKYSIPRCPNPNPSPSAATLCWKD